MQDVKSYNFLTFTIDFKTNDMACTYYSILKGNLKAHKKRVHEKVRVLDPHKFACSSCDFKTDKKFNLERHNVSCKMFAFIWHLLNISMGECFCWKDLDCRGPPCEPLGAFGGGVNYCS